MAKRANTNLKIYHSEFDLTGHHQKVGFTISADVLDTTVFGLAGRARMCGHKSVEFTHEGLWEAGTGLVDNALNGNLGSTGEILTLCPTGGADGEPAYTTQVIQSEYNPNGQVGGMLAFAGAAVGKGEPIVRGTVMATGAKTSTGNGTVRQIGAITATQTMYAALHVTATTLTGPPTLDVIVESDDAEAFTDPTTRITFTQVGDAVSSEWKSLAGAVTDDWWRVSWTIAGSTPSYTIACVLGILDNIS